MLNVNNSDNDKCNRLQYELIQFKRGIIDVNAQNLPKRGCSNKSVFVVRAYQGTLTALDFE